LIKKNFVVLIKHQNNQKQIGLMIGEKINQYNARIIDW
jgi:hypothetical protein